MAAEGRSLLHPYARCYPIESGLLLFRGNMKLCAAPGCVNPKPKMGRYCSMHYNRLYRIGSLDLPPKKSEEERFWEKVNTQTESGCWEWIGGIHQNGYGGFRDDKGKSWKAHRYSWQLKNGSIPDEILVCHKCDNKKCVRPDHLFLGTQKDNIQDRITKGRSNYAVGEQHGNHKLTAGIVIQIRCLFRQGITQRNIEKLTGVDLKQVHSIVRRKSWKWLDE